MDPLDDEAASALANLQRKRPPATSAPVPALAPAAARPSPLPTVLLSLLALVLVAIGIWALGAILYMSRVTPNVSQDDVAYPLIHWDWLHYRYADSSRLLAGSMLLAWPVAALLLAAIFFMRRTARRKISAGSRR
jgi:hypothetical protein